MASRRALTAVVVAAGWVACAGTGLACDHTVCGSTEASALVDQWVDGAEAWMNRVLDGVRERVERTHGVFVYTPGVGDALGGDWSDATAVSGATDVVVLVHGLDEPGDVWSDLAPALFEAGHTVVRFDYPNDQRIARSGASMFEAMAALRASGVERVRIVGHSMGGLVSREMLTADGLYAGKAEADGRPRVESLIVVGTPFQGSDFARLQWVGEVRDQVVRCVNGAGGDPRALLGFMYDGRGEAGEDLTPGSAYLQGACQRRMSDEIRLTSIIGQALPVDGDVAADALDGSWLALVVGDEGVDAMVALADRAADRIGDGVVTETSACVAGDDAEVIVVRANHRSLLRRTAVLDALASGLGMTVEAPPSIGLILDRVSASP